MNKSFRELLKDKKIQFTENRKDVLEIISNSDGPLTAEQIQHIANKNKKNLRLSTIYRNLNILYENDLLMKSISRDGQAYFQMKNDYHKHNLICSKCKKVILLDDCPIHDISENIEKQYGYKITDHSFEFIGICPKCLNKDK